MAVQDSKLSDATNIPLYLAVLFLPKKHRNFFKFSQKKISRNALP